MSGGLLGSGFLCLALAIARQDRCAGLLDVIGGNVDNSVSMKHVPVTTTGLLANPDGTNVDPDDAWFVVLRVLYDR